MNTIVDHHPSHVRIVAHIDGCYSGAGWQGRQRVRCLKDVEQLNERVNSSQTRRTGPNSYLVEVTIIDVANVPNRADLCWIPHAAAFSTSVQEPHVARRIGAFPRHVPADDQVGSRTDRGLRRALWIHQHRVLIHSSLFIAGKQRMPSWIVAVMRTDQNEVNMKSSSFGGTIDVGCRAFGGTGWSASGA